MTTGTTGGYQPPGGERPLGTTDPMETSTYSETAVGGSSGESRTDTAKSQAAEVGSTAKQAGGQVAGTAKDQAKQVAGETKAQARNLLSETQTQVRDQAGQQKQKAAGGLRTISDELRSMASGQMQPGQSGKVTDYAQQAADKISGLADWLEAREPGELVEDLRSFARRKPGMFLLGAAAAGIVAGRLTRGAVDVKRSESSGAQDGTEMTTGTTYGSTTGAYGSAGAEPDTLAGSRLSSDEDIVLPGDTVSVSSEAYGTRSTIGSDPR